MSKHDFKQILSDCLISNFHNGRITALFPGDPRSSNYSERYKFKQNISAKQQFVELQNTNFCGCIKIDCEERKYRAAILLLRGRILDCAYGDLNMSNHLWGKSALRQIWRQLGEFAPNLQAYPLSEPTVVAANSVFRGQTISATSQLAIEKIEFHLSEFNKQQAIGSILIGDGHIGSICLLYIYGSQILGVSNWTHDLSQKNSTKLDTYLETMPECLVLANKSTETEIESLMRTTFDLADCMF